MLGQKGKTKKGYRKENEKNHLLQKNATHTTAVNARLINSN